MIEIVAMDVGSFLRGLPGGESLNSAKDRMIAMGAKTHCSKHVDPYGAMLGHEWNTEARSRSINLLLKGEHAPVAIHVQDYHLSTEQRKPFVLTDGSEND